MQLKYSPIPVVVAPAGRTLGGGAEIVLHGARVRAHAELYCGLVEVGAGLVPAGGGCKELLLRHGVGVPTPTRAAVASRQRSRAASSAGAPAQEDLRQPTAVGAVPAIRPHSEARSQPEAPPEGRGPFPPVRAAFETIALATVSTSAEEARRLRFLRPDDPVTLDRERLLADARADAVALAESGYVPPEPPLLLLPGEGGRLALEQQIAGYRRLGTISEHDAVVAGKLAYVLTGGDASPITPVTEQHVLDLEREAFLSLCGMPKTQARMQALLQTGKPLRN
jgi:3-hydroxyacyl-CoA dehydrogenase